MERFVTCLRPLNVAYEQTPVPTRFANLRGSLKRSARAVHAQCARSATIWASGRTRDPYFVILGAPRGIMVTRSVGFDA